MTDEPDPFREAVTALTAAGREVEPTGDDLAFWLVDGEEMTDGDLLALAFRLGLMDGPDQLQ